MENASNQQSLHNGSKSNVKALQQHTNFKAQSKSLTTIAVDQYLASIHLFHFFFSSLYKFINILALNFKTMKYASKSLNPVANALPLSKVEKFQSL